MSFIERNKNWVLPLLGVGVLGVLYLNFKTFKPSPKVTEEPQAQEPAGNASSAGPPAAPQSSPAPEPTPSRPGAADLWSDLRALEEPWVGLNQTEALLKQGTQSLTQEALHPSPKKLDPPHSLRVPEPPPLVVANRSNVSAPSIEPPPEVDFLIRNPKGSSAWMGGSGFKVGQMLSGGWRVRRITPDMVEVEGPGGLVRRWTNPVKARTSLIVSSSEAP